MADIYLIVESTNPVIELEDNGNVLIAERTEPVMEVYNEDGLVIIVGEQGVKGVTGAAGGVGGSAIFTEHTVDYTILTDDLGVGNGVGMLSTVEKTFTLPEIIMGMSAPITIAKLGIGKLNVKSHTGQNVGFSDSGGSIYNNTAQTYVSITIQPIYSITRWILLNMTGTWRK